MATSQNPKDKKPEDVVEPVTEEVIEVPESDVPASA